jgi:hypothetical protein
MDERPLRVERRCAEDVEGPLPQRPTPHPRGWLPPLGSVRPEVSDAVSRRQGRVVHGRQDADQAIEPRLNLARFPHHPPGEI